MCIAWLCWWVMALVRCPLQCPFAIQELQALQQDVGTANTAAAASAAEMQNYKAESGQRMEDLLHDQAKLQQNYDQALEHCQSLLADMHSNLSKLGVITAEAAPSIAGQVTIIVVGLP